MNCNNYPYHTIYNNLIDKAFRIIEPYLFNYFDDIIHFEKYGEYQGDLRNIINNYFYELYRLAEWLKYVFDYLKSCNKTCLHKEEIEKTKNRFLINCPLICSNPRSKEIIQIFEEVIPLCETISYTWHPISSCYKGDLIYTKVKEYVNGVEKTIIIPPDATVEDIIQLGIPEPYATNLFNGRIVQLDSPNCCKYESLNLPYLDIVNITNNSITLSYIFQNDDAVGTITVNGQSINLTQPSGTITVTGLSPNVNYQAVFTVTNCAGSITVNKSFSTLPYIVTITLGPNISGNISLGNGLVVGTNVFTTYCSQVNISWTGINNLHEVTEFLVDGQDRLSDIVWNQIFNGKNIGGTFTIPCIDKDYTVYIEGVRALDCSQINVELDGNTITISV